ncbi:hypothetical protein DMN91_011526 [Ooceraea biroi]|uniref:MYND-type domain-containing protein n=1 Tax=Ooceraea biroi TaxID=2015173 RepID=A0A3L8D5T6_OOCBI|nr:uncharacterized protein LOC105286135 [Ooceraea biroi]RLU15770.1 hypothetical protein DMN91_011526 [Ooceraea biroi]
MDDNYNSCFYANACHVCKRFGDGVRLKRCGGCGMIAYCDQRHQKQHWPRHRRLCHAIQEVVRDNGLQVRQVSPQEWAQLKMNLMLLVAIRLPRRLDEYETQMFKFPRACLVCHERSNQLLEDCRYCASVSLCEEHRNDPAHSRHACCQLKLCFNLDKELSVNVNGESPNLDYLQRVSGSRTCRNMKDFIDAHMDVAQGQSALPPADVSVAVHSEYLTRPLTLVHGLRMLDYVPRGDSLVVHVVAANFIELETARAWEILLHLMSSLALVRLVMIGPELPSEIVSTSVCEDCVRQRKELSFEIHSALYENYVRGSSFVRPDVVAGFNTGIHEREEATYPEETWASSVRALAEQGCPLILSCYTRVEAEKETARINAILGKETKHVYAGINPFAGLRPYRDFETEGIFYQNNYVIVYSNL